MKKVITYGTYDLLHHGHLNLLRRAKELGDYLIVGITTENFDRARGKLLVQQPLSERIAAVRATGLADEIILEEYEGQKIDDIRKYGVDVFTVGSDWVGKFDYLSEYCQVVYLPRTAGVSSTELRDREGVLRIGVVGYGVGLEKFLNESLYISGVEVDGFYFDAETYDIPPNARELRRYGSYAELLENVDTVYIASAPAERPEYIQKALEKGRHVLCETPISLFRKETLSLYREAEERGLVLFEMLKTAYSLAFQRLVLLLKGGVIGQVKCVEATCTSLAGKAVWKNSVKAGGGAMISWGPYALLPALKILGRDFQACSFSTWVSDKPDGVDLYTRIHLIFDAAEADLTVGSGVKSEGDMVISGTRGYVYVPAPWWKMDYFEIRKEDSRENKRYFYQFEGEGIRYELAEFVRSVRSGAASSQLFGEDSAFISEVIERFRNGENVTYL